MNTTLIKDFILDCLDSRSRMLYLVRNENFISEDTMQNFEENLREAKNFINNLEDSEDVKDEKTKLYVKNIMEKFDSVIENIKDN